MREAASSCNPHHAAVIQRLCGCFTMRACEAADIHSWGTHTHARVITKTPSWVRQLLRIGTPQGFWGSGYFNEDSERAPPNLLKAVENKKLLSTAGKLKLLSSADKAGFNLAKVANICSAAVRAAHVLLAQTMRCLRCIDHTDGDARRCFASPTAAAWLDTGRWHSVSREMHARS